MVSISKRVSIFIFHSFQHPRFVKGKRDLASKITCALRNDKEVRLNSKPPSLAGVEKFIQAKVMAAVEGRSEKIISGVEANT